MYNRQRIFFTLALVFLAACQAKPSETPAILASGTIAVATPSLALTGTSEPKSTHTPLPTSSLTPMYTATPSNLDVCELNAAIELTQMTIAFVAKWDGDDEIYLIEADGSGLRQLTYNDAKDVGPHWSPDGEWIAYAAGGASNLKLYIIHEDGSGRLLQASDQEVSFSELAWSSDGKRIAFPSFGHIIAVDIISGSSLDLTKDKDFGAGSPSWSPDGLRLAFDANVGGRNPIYRLYSVRSDGSELKMFDPDLGMAWRPMWHPVKDEILFVSSVRSIGENVYRISADGTRLEMLTDTGSISKDNAMWSPNGQMVAYEAIDWEILDDNSIFVQASIHVMNYDGSKDTTIAQGPEDEEFVIDGFSWAPDNRHIAFIARNRSGEGVPSDLYVIDICDREARLIAEDVVGYAPSWKP